MAAQAPPGADPTLHRPVDNLLCMTLWAKRSVWVSLVIPERIAELVGFAFEA